MATPTQGVGAATQRAEESELATHDNWKQAEEALRAYRAQADPDPAILAALDKSAKLAFDKYKGARDGLLNYDSKVDQSKRLSGAVVPQADVVKTLRMFIRYWKIANENSILSVSQSVIKCKTPVEACEIVDDILRASLAQSLEQGIDQERLPAFMIEVIREELL